MDNASAYFNVDDQPTEIGPLESQFNNASMVTIEGYNSGTINTDYYVDDIRIRKYVYPEPITILGGEGPTNVVVVRLSAGSPAAWRGITFFGMSMVLALAIAALTLFRRESERN